MSHLSSQQVPHDIIVEISCENDHKQKVTYKDTDREFVEMQLLLLTGSDKIYLHPPGPDSIIGKCGICGKQLKGEILDADINANI